LPINLAFATLVEAIDMHQMHRSNIDTGAAQDICLHGEIIDVFRFCRGR